nr:MAG TPA: hypothetical protein [Caudoviricetes sp.]
MKSCRCCFMIFIYPYMLYYHQKYQTPNSVTHT